MKIRFINLIENKRTFCLYSATSVLFLGLAIFLGGCDFTGKSEPGRDKILKSPPFAGITDSIKNSPSDADLYLRRAGLLALNNLHELATKDYQKAWELKPGEGTALEYASNLLLTNHVEKGTQLLKECIKRYPANTEFSRRLSEVYTQQGEYSKALQQYNTILQTDPGNFMAYYNKGMLQCRMRDTAAALVSLEKSYSLQPTVYTGLELANIYASSRNPRALVICDELLKKDSLDALADATYIKGTYYFNGGNYTAAMRQFDETIRRDWKFTDAYLDKGIILFEQKNFQSAIDIFTKAATVSNTSPDAYYWLARCYESMGRKEEAIENYERTLALDQSFVEAREKLKKLSK